MDDSAGAKTPANANPWYVLMTLYGEQTGEDIDRRLLRRNRAAWNAWSGQAMSMEAQEKAAASSNIPVAELRAWEAMEAEVTRLHEAEMRKRNGENFVYPGLPGFTEAADLSFVDFQSRLMLDQAIFGAVVLFNGATFNKQASFNFATFRQSASFNSATFGGQARFNFTTFCGEAVFPTATFGGEAGFHNSTFSQEANFHTATFSSTAGFDAATFNGRALFIVAKFDGKADFQTTRFRRSAWFQSATFDKRAWFKSATFSEAARFDSVTLHGETELESATFSGFAHFPKATFGVVGKDVSISFSDCQFLKPTSFHNSNFHSRYPDLSGAVLHEKTNFTADAKFWPKAVSDPIPAKAACATIRHALGRQGLPEEEHFFYRREMGFAARIGGFWQRLPYRLFGLFSEFGYSIAKPTLWLLGLWLIPTTAFLAADYWNWLTLGAHRGPVQPFGLSIVNVLPIPGLHARTFGPVVLANLNPWLKLLGALQTLLSLPLLFFLGLGLRQRFRLR